MCSAATLLPASDAATATASDRARTACSPSSRSFARSTPSGSADALHCHPTPRRGRPARRTALQLAGGHSSAPQRHRGLEGPRRSSHRKL